MRIRVRAFVGIRHLRRTHWRNHKTGLYDRRPWLKRAWAMRKAGI